MRYNTVPTDSLKFVEGWGLVREFQANSNETPACLYKATTTAQFFLGCLPQRGGISACLYKERRALIKDGADLPPDLGGWGKDGEGGE
jgi:hypothetical protein